MSRFDGKLILLSGTGRGRGRVAALRFAAVVGSPRVKGI